MTKINLKSYAKINLGLSVLGKRPDGYHEIQTIYQQIDLHDNLEIEPADSSIEVICSAPNVPSDASNLCFKAAKLLRTRFSLNHGVIIKLDKVIPVGAGLGGGSSNAASVLMGLNLLWKLKVSEQELLQLSAEIGSDVPFFILGGSVLARGKGELLEPVTLPMDYWCLLVYPNIEISTTWVYKNFNFDLTNRKKNVKLTDAVLSQSDLRRLAGNELEPIVFNSFPQLERIKEQLYQSGAIYASMSGSGSSLYGLYASKKEAEKGRELFAARYLTFITRPIRQGLRELIKNV